MNTWSVRHAWNAAILGKEREIKPRDYLYASEIGIADIDIILRLKGTKPSNPPDDRANRKFFAGNLFEDVLFLALLRCGVILESQKKGEYQYDGLLRVSGRCDMICGGEINVDKCESEIRNMKLTEHMENISLSVLYALASEYGSMTLKPILVECKSSSLTMFNKYAKSDAPSDSHVMQVFHYLKSFHMDEGRIVYICKDDCRMIEFPVFNPLGGESDVEIKYRTEIKRLTDLYQSNELPDKESEIIFENGKFSKNWRIEYSNYLTMIYGYKAGYEYAEKTRSICDRWNRIIKRIKEGKELTKDNKAGISEIKSMFPDFESFIEKAEIEEIE